jgi:hypothetical protein
VSLAVRAVLKSKGIMWKDSWKLVLKYDTSKNNFLQATRINAL